MKAYSMLSTFISPSYAVHQKPSADIDIYKYDSITVYQEKDNDNYIRVFNVQTKYHRLDGPAIETVNSSGCYKEWYLNDNKIKCDSQEKFERIVKLINFT